MANNSLNNHYPCWAELKKNSRKVHRLNLPATLAKDPARHQGYSLEAANLNLNYSRHLLNDASLKLFNQLWRQAKISNALDRMFLGEKINATENRAAWHAELRAEKPPKIVSDTLAKMAQLVKKIHSGAWKGYSGQTITDVVNVGIGGSDLGPRFVTNALAAFQEKNNSGSFINFHFVSNVDPADITSVLNKLKAENTLFIISSKSFATLETLANAQLVKEWFLQYGKQSDIKKHFIAISTAKEKAEQFGIAMENIFPLWDWVGGRYSLWSAIGLPIAISCGMEGFEKLLMGARKMDMHTRSTTGTNNMPAMLAFLEVWYSHFFNAQTHAVLPYSHALRLLPDFLQQLTMESNGKQTMLNGQPTDFQTGSILWGAAGSNGQHSFHQLIHQGTHLIPVDFILPIQSSVKLNTVENSLLREQINTQQQHLIANCLAQSEAMLYGKNIEQVKLSLKKQGLSPAEIKKLAPHLVIPGNRPHSLISFDALTPEILGALIALYEHKTYIQSVILRINAFDQWGVELGKNLSAPIYQALSEDESNCTDDLSQQVISRYKNMYKIK